MLALQSLGRVRRIAAGLEHAAERLPAEPRVGDADRRLATRLGRSPNTEYLTRLFDRLAQASKDQDFGKIVPRDWRNAMRILWDGDPALVDRPGVVENFGIALRKAKRAGSVRRLIFAYLSRFDIRQPSFREVGALIRDELATKPWPKLSVWRERDQIYGMFSPANAVKTISAKIIQRGEIDYIEQNLGIDGQLTQQRFMEQMWAAALTLLEQRLRAGGLSDFDIPQILGKLRLGSGLRFASLRATTADALLSPWASHSLPNVGLQTHLKEFFLELFGDPYTKRGNWQGVRPETTSVMRRWLAQESLRLFFEIITQASDRDDYASGHWKYRRAFWQAYLTRGALDEAWMVLGTGVERMARDKLTPGIGYGRLTGGNSLHAVLVMRVGPLVFAEWSFNGKCRAWATDNAVAPELGLARYESGEFKLPSIRIDEKYTDDGLSHINSESGYWQRILEKFIRGRIGISVSSREYMP